MKFIPDSDGVDVIIPPVERLDGFQVKLDFNYGKLKLQELENKARNWDMRLYDGRSLVGRVKFSAFQFMADGIERRTISLTYIELERPYRGQGKTYDVARFVLNQVKRDCDREWGPVELEPVLFIEKKSFSDLPREQHSNVFSFLKKISERILGIKPADQPVPDHDLVATAIGNDISLQLIEKHLERSSTAKRR